jgi:predicted nucleic acid-binding protein
VPTETWILNASPIITLAKAGYLSLFDELPSTFLVPGAVVREILNGPVSDPARKALESGWGRPASPNKVSSLILEWGLGEGETEVLALALEVPNCSVILDDRAARKCAMALKIPLLGTVGIVLGAKRKGLIPLAVPVLKALLSAGLRIDEETLRVSLQRATGEVWPG